MLSHHLLTDHEYPNHSHVILLKVGLVAAIITMLIVQFNQFVCSCLFSKKKFKEMPDYLDSLKIERVGELVQDEKYFRQKGGFSILPQKALDKLEKRLLLKDYEKNEGSKIVVETVHDSGVEFDEPHKSKVIDKLEDNKSEGSHSSSIFGSFFSQGGSNSNKLVGQHSYQPFYDVDY